MEKSEFLAKNGEKSENCPKITSRTSLFHPCSRRFHFLILLMIGFFAIIAMRINMGVGMSCMVNSTAVMRLTLEEAYDQEIPEITVLTRGHKPSKSCQQYAVDDAYIVNSYGGTYIWSGNLQGWIISSLFYGSLLSLLPAGYLADTQPPKLLLSIAVSIYVVGTASIPFAAMNGGWVFLCLIRFVMGMGDGLAIPSINKMVTCWIPTNEKSTAVTIYTTGFSLASIFGVPLFAFLCTTSLRWPFIFYFCALFGGIWLVFWQYLSSSSFETCRGMTDHELQYLRSRPELQKYGREKKLNIPFKKMFFSMPVISLLLVAFSISLVVTFIHMHQFTFFKQVLYLNPVNNALYGMIPPIVEIFTKFGWSMLMDHLKAKNILTVDASVKLSQLICGILITFVFVMISFLADCENPLITLALFCVGSCALSLTAAGYFTSMLSIAPAYTGIISSATMLTGILARVATPIMIPIFNKTGTLEEWRPIFFIISGTTVISTVLFVVYGSGEVQDWAKNPYGISSVEEHSEETKKKSEMEVEACRASTLT